jgi:phosphatidylserine decarboxylase
LAPEGRKILSILLLITSALFLLGIFVKLPIFSILGGISSFLLVFSLNFFRDPDRKIPKGKNIIISPADGKVTNIQKVDDIDVGKDATLISIFLNVFSVHINRIPLDGKVISVKRKSGQFVSAYHHDASDVNEQVTTILDTSLGKIKVKQIAGIIARRILCHAVEGDSMALGSRLGFIMFGSRTDVILPPAVDVLVKENQRIKGIETIIGKYK